MFANIYYVKMGNGKWKMGNGIWKMGNLLGEAFECVEDETHLQILLQHAR